MNPTAVAMHGLGRLLQARSVAVLGGGAWCESAVKAAATLGFTGELWPVHPAGKTVGDLIVYCDIAELPSAPDAVFLGINRYATIEAVARLREIGAGGAVCFAAGFSEAAAEDAAASGLQAKLLTAAGDMAILGPNCYGFLNALDRVALWPDQHGLRPVESGVAILSQSSNIALNLTFQTRGLPVAYVVTCGNMAKVSAAQIGQALISDDRVTALGIHTEGFGELREWEALAMLSNARRVPVVVLKSGRSAEARAAAVSHTASLAGRDAGAQAFLDRLGFARVQDLPTFLETLNLLHMVGTLATPTLAAISCSGGEAGLIADMAQGSKLSFPPLTKERKRALRTVLGSKVALSNPLDYHTYIWRDADAMTRAWTAVAKGGAEITLAIVDYPTTDARDWRCTIQAALRTHAQTGKPFAVVATLGELMPSRIAEELRNGGVVPMRGLAEALGAVEAAATIRMSDPKPVLLPCEDRPCRLLSELRAKKTLRKYGVPVPNGTVTEADRPEIGNLAAPFAVKAVGLAHKSNSNGVVLNVQRAALSKALRTVGTSTVLVEEMVSGGVAEILVSILHDPAHGFLLTVGTGGILAELWRDSCSLLVPASREAVHRAILSLGTAPLLFGYRGQPAADIEALIDLVMSLQDCVVAEAASIRELELNPVICMPDGAVAVDALIRVVERGNVP